MADRRTSAQRILLGAESAEDALRAARLLPVLVDSAGASATFGGLLVVHPSPAASQPVLFRHVVTTSGRILAAPDREAMPKIVAGETRAFRRILSEAARSAGADWSADVTIGGLGAKVIAVAGAWDIVVLGHRTLHRRRGPVVVLSVGDQRDDDLLSVAARLASAQATDVESLQLPRTQVPLTDWLAGRLDRLNAAAVVLDAATATFDDFSDLTAILTAARCPIVILGGARLRPRLAHTTQITPPPKTGT